MGGREPSPVAAINGDRAGRHQRSNQDVIGHSPVDSGGVVATNQSGTRLSPREPQIPASAHRPRKNSLHVAVSFAAGISGCVRGNTTPVSDPYPDRTGQVPPGEDLFAGNGDLFGMRIQQPWLVQFVVLQT